MTDNAPIITSLESIRTLKLQKYNPLRALTPASLTRMLESFEIGYLREPAMLFEIIADRDDTIKSVKPKREKEVSQLDKQVLALPGSGAAGDAHREVLEDFWNNVMAINAYDRNERGGFRRLVKQMMSAVSYRYACHHIVWRPSRGRLRATFEFVPLWLFENRSGTLRYLGVDDVLFAKSRYGAGATKTRLMATLVLAFSAVKGLDPEDPSNIKRFYRLLEGQRYRVYEWRDGPKKYRIAVEHYELTKITSTLGIRKLTVS